MTTPNHENGNTGNGGDPVKHTFYSALLTYLRNAAPWNEDMRLRECHAGRGAYAISDRDPHCTLLHCLHWNPTGQPPACFGTRNDLGRVTWSSMNTCRRPGEFSNGRWRWQNRICKIDSGFCRSGTASRSSREKHTLRRTSDTGTKKTLFCRIHLPCGESLRIGQARRIR